MLFRTHFQKWWLVVCMVIFAHLPVFANDHPPVFCVKKMMWSIVDLAPV
jgi:hypothetical protein